MAAAVRAIPPSSDCSKGAVGSPAALFVQSQAEAALTLTERLSIHAMLDFILGAVLIGNAVPFWGWFFVALGGLQVALSIYLSLRGIK